MAVPSVTADAMKREKQSCCHRPPRQHPCLKIAPSETPQAPLSLADGKGRHLPFPRPPSPCARTQAPQIGGCLFSCKESRTICTSHERDSLTWSAIFVIRLFLPLGYHRMSFSQVGRNLPRVYLCDPVQHVLHTICAQPVGRPLPLPGPSQELRRKAEAQAIAASLYQPISDKKGELFTVTPQKIFAHLLTFGPTPTQLAAWLSNPDEIDKRVLGTKMQVAVSHLRGRDTRCSAHESA